MKKKSPSLLSRIGHLHALSKLIVCILIAIIITCVSPHDSQFHSNIMLGWDTFCFMMIVFSWITFLTIKPTEIRAHSRVLDISKFIIYVLIIICTLASLAEVVFLLSNETSHRLLIIVIAGMALSWILIHTIFAFHYAHLYYMNDKNDAGVHAGGLEFPEDQDPDYRDFAYFSFVLGMTFQVSDVQISSKKLRRIALLHGFISFFFNTFFVALTINFIAGLKGLVNLRK